MNLFEQYIEEEAIERIKKFSKIAEKLDYPIVLGFSGGKDSVVIYDLAKRAGIKFTSYFNHSFESPTTLKFIKKYYPDVKFRRPYNVGFLENIKKHNGILPTIDIAYCCSDYKHNKNNKDKAVIVGVRRSESFRRRKRSIIDRKKRIKKYVDDYFLSSCQSDVAGNVDVLLRPIIDWTDEDVWNYIKKYKLPVSSEYEHCKRVGCLICPKRSLSRNYYYLIKYPKLINVVIRILEQSGNDFIISKENKYYGDTYFNKIKFILKWLNYSFRELKGKDKKAYNLILDYKWSEMTNDGIKQEEWEKLKKKYEKAI